MGQTLPDIASITIKLSKQLETGKIEVPLLPESAQKVISLTNDPDSDAAQVAKVIQSDPTLGGHVMRIANSAAYTPNSNLVSIQQAISRLGMVEINTIALSTSMSNKLFNAEAYKDHIALIWEHALATAFWSKEVARSMRSNVEAAFLCGLLHSIGKPVLLQAISDMQNNPDALTDDVLDTLYLRFESEIAGLVCQSWGLPELVTEAICFYRDFTKAEKASELAATVAFGSALAMQMVVDKQLLAEPLLSSPALNLVNLYPDEIEALIEKESQVSANMALLTKGTSA